MGLARGRKIKTDQAKAPLSFLNPEGSFELLSENKAEERNWKGVWLSLYSQFTCSFKIRGRLNTEL